MTGPGGSLSQARWILTGFGAVWCVGVGLATLLVHSSVARHRDAELRFRAVPAVVLSSRVHAERSLDDRDRERFLYRPVVRFAYEVDGRRYESDRYAFDETSSSDDAYATRVAQKYPPGRTVTAWIDPDRPEVAILERSAPGPVTFGLFFLRPFWAAGIFILFHAAWYWILGFHLPRYLARSREPPCRIPGWGRLRRVGDGFAVTRRPALLLWAVAPYFLATFASLFVLVAGDWESDPRAQDAAAAFCLAVTAVTVAIGLLQGRRVSFRRDRVVVERPFRREEMAAADVASVEVGEARAGGRTPRPLALYLKAGDGRTLRLNVFSLPFENAAVAARARQQVAGLLALGPSGKDPSSS
jgi:hypothetical protein